MTTNLINIPSPSSFPIDTNKIFGAELSLPFTQFEIPYVGDCDIIYTDALPEIQKLNLINKTAFVRVKSATENSLYFIDQSYGICYQVDMSGKRLSSFDAKFSAKKVAPFSDFKTITKHQNKFNVSTFHPLGNGLILGSVQRERWVDPSNHTSFAQRMGKLTLWKYKTNYYGKKLNNNAHHLVLWDENTGKILSDRVENEELTQFIQLNEHSFAAYSYPNTLRFYKINNDFSIGMIKEISFPDKRIFSKVEKLADNKLVFLDMLHESFAKEHPDSPLYRMNVITLPPQNDYEQLELNQFDISAYGVNSFSHLCKSSALGDNQVLIVNDSKMLILNIDNGKLVNEVYYKDHIKSNLECVSCLPLALEDGRIATIFTRDGFHAYIWHFDANTAKVDIDIPLPSYTDTWELRALFQNTPDELIFLTKGGAYKREKYLHLNLSAQNNNVIAHGEANNSNFANDYFTIKVLDHGQKIYTSNGPSLKLFTLPSAKLELECTSSPRLV